MSELQPAAGRATLRSPQKPLQAPPQVGCLPQVRLGGGISGAKRKNSRRLGKTTQALGSAGSKWIE
jgi:hypothetical protein